MHIWLNYNHKNTNPFSLQSFQFHLCRESKADLRPEERRAQRAVAYQTRERTGPVAAQAHPLAEADLE